MGTLGVKGTVPMLPRGCWGQEGRGDAYIWHILLIFIKYFSNIQKRNAVICGVLSPSFFEQNMSKLMFHILT